MSLVQKALTDISSGKLVIVVDDHTRENEGDLIMAAERVTPQAINFMITQGRGLVCVPMSEARAQTLKLRRMVAHNTAEFKTNFTISVDAKRGTTTGISAHDRAVTIAALANSQTKPIDLARPGHVFPLIANHRGVIGRKGHTEAAVDLCTLAGLKPVGVLCEILGPTGRAATGRELKALAKKYKLAVISIQDIIEYRRRLV